MPKAIMGPALLATLAVCTALQAAPLAKFEPADGVCYHGVCIPGVWSEKETQEHLTGYRTNVTKAPLVLHSWFAHAKENGKWRTWHWMEKTPDGGECVGSIESQVAVSRKLNMVPVIAWAWMDYQQPDKSPALQDVAAGKYDWLIDDWIKGVKEYKAPLFIRLSHEMDGDWYPYSEGYKANPTRNTAADFVTYYKYVVDRFRKAGVTNVAWVWCVNGDRSGGKDWPDYWPGPEYVDWIGVDPYSSRNPREMIEPLLAQFPGKPVMIPECGTSPEVTQYNTKFAGEAAWTSELFDVIEAHPRVKAVCWFQWDSKWQVQRVPAQRDVFAKRINAPRYKHKWTP